MGISVNIYTVGCDPLSVANQSPSTWGFSGVHVDGISFVVIFIHIGSHSVVTHVHIYPHLGMSLLFPPLQKYSISI